jgi:long-chain-fatty-acid--CoA ligase ACSBG
VAGRDKPSEGEICYRGRHIMMGYMKDPTKTAEAIDPEGWLHSGDVGVLDADGLLHITGRIKGLIITAGGENIAPVPIEDKLKALLPAVSNAMMVSTPPLKGATPPCRGVPSSH